MRKTLLTRVSLAGVIATVAGCSSTPPPPPAPVVEKSFKTVASQFMTSDATRSQGTIVDKGMFYPKETFSLSYRYCSASAEQAQKEIDQFYQLAKKTCKANSGTMINQDTDAWCVSHPNTQDETPIFSARITSTDLWADVCPTGPFVTMRVIENKDVDKAAWIDGAKLLGYQPYSVHRKIVPSNQSQAALFSEKETPAPDQEPWTEETGFIATHIGETVCMYKKTKDEAYGVTYKGKIQSVNDDRVSVLATEKLKGDIRIAPEIDPLPWHKEAVIEADARSWFICQ